MEWYWILLIVLGSVTAYLTLLFPLWALLRAASIQSRREEEFFTEKGEKE